jgi:hypothetical protein
VRTIAAETARSIDEVRVTFKGRERCYGEDANQLVKRASDVNGDGRFDQSWTFDPTRKGCATVARAGESGGKPEPSSAIDICQQLSDGGR